MKCYNIKATEINERNGTTVITADFSDILLRECDIVNIELNVPIKDKLECTRVVISGYNEGQLYVLSCFGNYWRPCNIKCKTIISLKYLNDPEHFYFRCQTGGCKR